MKSAVCLLSGGMDSATALYIARSQGWAVMGLTVDYGQSHRREIDSARALAATLSIEHVCMSVDLPWQGSALLDKAIPIPKADFALRKPGDIPATYVPARNIIFLSLAVSCAEARGAEAVFIGANVLDYSGYPDCRPDFLACFEDMVRLGTKAGVEGRPIRIEAPLLRMSKKEIIFAGQALGVPFEHTWSCYRGGGRPCRDCDACRLREKGFGEAGLSDPLFRHAAHADV